MLMIKKEINFSDLVDFFKKHNVPTFDEDIDKFGGYFITAARIAAVIIAPDPISKISVFCASIDAGSLRASKLFSWLPDKFKYKDREKSAVQKYELASYVNFILLQIAIKNGVKEILMPHIAKILKSIKLEDEDKLELKNKCEECDKEKDTLNLPAIRSLSSDDIGCQAFKIIDPIFSVLTKCADKSKETTPVLKKIDYSKIKEFFLENINIQYQAFVINFSSEFPEFALWADITQKEKIIKEFKKASRTLKKQSKTVNDQFLTQTEIILKKIEEVRDNSFIEQSGFPSFIENYDKMFKVQRDHLLKYINTRTLENINAHQNEIKRELTRLLSDNTDVEHIIYPENKDIYIAQSFEAISYRKKDHRKGFLTADSLGEKAEKGENIGNYLLKTLIDPNYATRPIVLLGNPGAGKSMLSKMFAGLLCDTTDFIPFLIKLRSVASSSSNISEHINKGLENTIANLSDVNWLDWAKEFRNRIPVIIMDGFDELMQTSNRELNSYVNSIREFQEKAINSNVCVRIILTSRISVMQDVFIPEGTKIIKLNSFDIKRRDLWINKWNTVQKKKEYKFSIPKNAKIELLAEEPLLLFMLAVYDFENSELQNLANDKNFNQSKLYDSLLERFIKRQVLKEPAIKDLAIKKRETEEELFRLRLGMIALMMFLNDTTSRDTQKLQEEMIAFGINKSSIISGNILGGFFFIHANKSITEGAAEKFNYEFLHKTFGEFLAADFMLRVAKKQFERMFDNNQEIIAKKETFYFCFGYNWLHKHNNIQNFLFEHAKRIIKPDSVESKFICNFIKTDLRELFEKGHNSFPVTDIRLLEKKSVIEHLGIYSQNIVFLWLALANEKQIIKFDVFDESENMGVLANEPKYESQDRDELNKSKMLWKRLAKLWALVGNFSATAKLAEWINISENENHIELNRTKSELIHNFSDSASVCCNDFELLLSFFDNEYKFAKNRHPLEIIEKITIKKPEFFALATDVILHRFHDLYSTEGLVILNWFVDIRIRRKQQIAFIKKVGFLKGYIGFGDFIEAIHFISQKIAPILVDNIQAINEYLKILVDLKSYFPLSQIANVEILDESFHRLSRNFGHFEDDIVGAVLENFRLQFEIAKYFSFRRKSKGDVTEELHYRMIRDMRHYIGNNTSFTFEYLRLLNEMHIQYPLRRMHVEEYNETSRIISRAVHMEWKNPLALFEYFKWLNGHIGNYPIDQIISREFFIELVDGITKEWENISRADPFNLLELLRMLFIIGKHFNMENVIPHGLFYGYCRKLSFDFVFIVRDNPKVAHEFLQVLKYFLKHFPHKDLWDQEMIYNSIYRISKEMDMDFHSNSQSVLLYLEFLLITQAYDRRIIDEQHVSRLVESIRNMRLGYSSSIYLKAAILLIQFGAPTELLARLLDKHPRFGGLFAKSPEIAHDIILTAAELSQYERFN